MDGDKIMKAYGYSKKNKTRLIELSECTLECTLEEIEELIEFITNYKKDLENGIDNNLWLNDTEVIIHRHLDYLTNESDFILATRLKNTADESKTMKK